MWQWFYRCVSALIIGLIPTGIAMSQSSQRPNIILIYADDLGWKDVGYQGTDYYETPNIDRLATEGMVFSAAYSSAGNCVPSRACLLSGTYTPRHGVYAVGNTNRGPKKSQRLIAIPNKSGLARDNVTIADALKEAGYKTGIFGKWHLGGKDGARPKEQGFETVVESHDGWEKEVTGDPKGIYALTEAAGKFIETNRDEPFFVYLAHYAIHTKHQARRSSIEKFQSKKPGTQHSNALYAACLFDLDDGIGKLLARVKDLGLEENTLVVFTSDNGGTQQSSQEPLRGNKGGYYEGGIREPMIVRWPKVIAAGTKCDEPVIHIDLFPTFLEVANATVPEGKVLDGESLMPLLSAKGKLKRTAIFWHFPGYLDTAVIRGRGIDVRDGFRSRPVTVIRKGDWKLHLFHEEWQLDGGIDAMNSNQSIELYNLKDDESERYDLSSIERGKRSELLAALLGWQKTIHAQMPSEPNPDYQKPESR